MLPIPKGGPATNTAIWVIAAPREVDELPISTELKTAFVESYSYLLCYQHSTPQLLGDSRRRGDKNVGVFHVKHCTGDCIRIFMCIHWPHLQQTKQVAIAQDPRLEKRESRRQAQGGRWDTVFIFSSSPHTR